MRKIVRINGNLYAVDSINTLRVERSTALKSSLDELNNLAVLYINGLNREDLFLVKPDRIKELEIAEDELADVMEHLENFVFGNTEYSKCIIETGREQNTVGKYVVKVGFFCEGNATTSDTENPKVQKATQTDTTWWVTVETDHSLYEDEYVKLATEFLYKEICQKPCDEVNLDMMRSELHITDSWVETKIEPKKLVSYLRIHYEE